MTVFQFSKIRLQLPESDITFVKAMQPYIEIIYICTIIKILEK